MNLLVTQVVKTFMAWSFGDYFKLGIRLLVSTIGDSEFGDFGFHKITANLDTLVPK